MTDIEKNLPEEENLEAEIITLIDEETGKEQEFELLDRAEIDGNLYFALAIVGDESDEYVILKAHEDGEDIVFESIEDDALIHRITTAQSFHLHDEDSIPQTCFHILQECLHDGAPCDGFAGEDLFINFCNGELLLFGQSEEGFLMTGKGFTFAHELSFCIGSGFSKVNTVCHIFSFLPFLDCMITQNGNRKKRTKEKTP